MSDRSVPGTRHMTSGFGIEAMSPRASWSAGSGVPRTGQREARALSSVGAQHVATSLRGSAPRARVGPDVDPKPPRPSPLVKVVFGACLLALPFLVFVLMEGASSLLLLARDTMASRRGQVAERRHTRYDPDLGWVNIPNATVRDLYGPGRDLHINGQGFR